MTETLKALALNVEEAVAEVERARVWLIAANNAYNTFVQEVIGVDTLPPHTPIAECGFDVRVYNCLKRAGVSAIQDILDKSYDDLIKVRNLGRHSLEAVIDTMRRIGYVEWSAEMNKKHRQKAS